MTFIKLALPFAANTIAFFGLCSIDLKCNNTDHLSSAEWFEYKKVVEKKPNKNKESKGLIAKEASPDTLNRVHNAKTLFESIEKYSNEYNIPKHIMFNIAYKETRYQGPNDEKYIGRLTSPSGALGPMQVMVRTASFVQNTKVSPQKLKDDIDFNVQTSAKLLKYLFDQYKDWKKVCGAYNTGRPIINQYAVFCNDNINYEKNWGLP
jgi:hypothetical protein